MQLVSKLGAYSVKHMTGKKADGKEYNFYSFEKRTFNKEKNDWESKDVILNSADIAVAAALLAQAVAQVAKDEAAAGNERLAARAADAGDGVPF